MARTTIHSVGTTVSDGTLTGQIIEVIALRGGGTRYIVRTETDALFDVVASKAILLEDDEAKCEACGSEDIHVGNPNERFGGVVVTTCNVCNHTDVA